MSFDAARIDRNYDILFGHIVITYNHRDERSIIKVHRESHVPGWATFDDMSQMLPVDRLHRIDRLVDDYKRRAHSLSKSLLSLSRIVSYDSNKTNDKQHRQHEQTDGK